MQHRMLGTSSLELPVVTFGAWAIGGLFWGGSDDRDAIEAIQAAIDHGMDAIDTAPIYGCGHSEMLVGQAIRGRRDRVKLLTKCGLRWDDTAGERHFSFPKPGGGEVVAYKNVRRDSIAFECEQSLKRLGTDVIDLYQVHWPSTTATAEETMGALVKLRDQGKIREIGASNYGSRQMAEAARFGPLASNQVKYNLLERSVETDPLPYCCEHGLGVLCYSPMAMGLLSGKVTMGRTFPDSDIRASRPWFLPANRKRVLNALDAVRPIAEAHGLTLAQLAVAWVIAQPGITTALVGARNAEQTAENAGAANCTLKPDEQELIRSAFEALGEPTT
jgi:aryl-alcohol dehydrogenase-like predicted oxidoreductase